MANELGIPLLEFELSELEEVSPTLETPYTREQTKIDELNKAIQAGYGSELPKGVLSAEEEALEYPFITPEGTIAAILSGGITGMMTSPAPTAFGAFMTGAIRRATINLELGLMSEATDIITQNKLAAILAPVIAISLQAGLGALIDRGEKVATAKFAETLQQGMASKGQPMSSDHAKAFTAQILNKMTLNKGWGPLKKSIKLNKWESIIRNQSGKIDPKLLGIPEKPTSEKQIESFAKSVQDMLTQPGVFEPTIGAIAPGVVGKLAEATKTREVKSAIRQLTGQIKASEVMVSEDKALQAVMQAQARTAKKVFRVGKIAGIEAQKEHATKVVEAAGIRDELKNRINTAVNTIKTQPTKNLPLEYKKAIGEIQSKLDVENIKPGMIFKQIKLRKLIKEKETAGEEFAIPEEMLDLLSSTNPNSMTVDDLEAYADLIKQVTYVGDMENKLLKVAQGQELKGTIHELTETISKAPFQQQAIPEDTPLTETTKKEFMAGKAKRRIHEWYLKDKRVERILLRLDGYDKNGPNYRYIFKPLNDAASESYKNQIDRNTQITNIVSEANSSGQKPLKLRQINDRLKMTDAGIMEVYAATLNEQKLSHSVEGNKLSKQDIQDVVAAITPKEKTIVDRTVSEYYGPQYDRNNAVNMRMYNNELPREEGYTQIRIDKELETIRKGKPKLESILFGKKNINKVIARGHIKSRVKESKQPLKLDFYENTARNIEEVEHYNAFAEVSRDIRKIIYSPEYKASVTKAIGKEGYKIIQDWYLDTISRRPYIQSAAGPIYKMLRNHTAVGLLGLNMVTSMKQFPSLFVAASIDGVSGQTILNGLYKMASDPKVSLAKMYEKSPQMKNRAVERDIVELFRSEKAQDIFRGKHSLSIMAMKPLREVDKFTVGSVWTGVYEESIKKMSEEKAVEFADYVVRNSQPAFDIKDLPAFFRGGELEKMATMFMNQRNQNWNIFSTEIVEKLLAKKVSKPEAFRKLIYLWVIPAFILGAATRGRFKRTTKEAILDAVKYSPIAGTFLIGSVLDAALSDWDWNLPIAQPIHEFGRAISRKKLKTKIKHGVKFLGYAAKIPVNQMWRTGEGAYDLLTKETNDLRRLIYSEYALQEPKGLQQQQLSELEESTIPNF